MVPTKSQVTKAGKVLISSKSASEIDRALELINEWRTNHLVPLTYMRNIFSRLLGRNNIKPILVSQRLKRLTSIEYKLDLHKSMALGGMQDIGGFRAVVKDAKELFLLKEIINNRSKSKSYELVGSDDYVAFPKISGYRSIHYVYKYISKVNKYDGVRLELQIRTKLQHNWATAVETAGIFTGTSLKSGKGHDEWLDFFRIVSSLFAIKEKLPILEEHKELTMHQLMVKCYDYSTKLNVILTLNALRISAREIEFKKPEGHYYILFIDFVDRHVNITPFKKKDSRLATNRYMNIEKTINPGKNAVVLVSASSIKSLKKAYPSYFLDTSEFIDALHRINLNCQKLGLVKKSS